MTEESSSDHMVRRRGNDFFFDRVVRGRGDGRSILMIVFLFEIIFCFMLCCLWIWNTDLRTYQQMWFLHDGAPPHFSADVWAFWTLIFLNSGFDVVTVTVSNEICGNTIACLAPFVHALPTIARCAEPTFLQIFLSVLLHVIHENPNFVSLNCFVHSWCHTCFPNFNSMRFFSRFSLGSDSEGALLGTG
jgi:hypothetical protein